MVSPALQIGPAEAAAVPLKTESPVSTVGGGISGIYRSLEVQDDSKTPYSDATQVSSTAANGNDIISGRRIRNRTCPPPPPPPKRDRWSQAARYAVAFRVQDMSAL